MKKLLFGLLLLSFVITGVAQAENIPSVVDPLNGPSVSTVPVYNSSNDTLSANDLVVWNISNSTGTDDNWVIDNSTAATNIVAGIVYPANIPSKKVGTVAVRGVVTVNADSAGIDANGLICASGTKGRVTSCSGANENKAVGFAVATGASTTVKAFINTL